jgi:Mn2+/Fe2+ NRAMP family transporter
MRFRTFLLIYRNNAPKPKRGDRPRALMGNIVDAVKPNSTALAAGKNVRKGRAKSLLQKLGPGLITGASDDDPSGIGTYSQVGAQFGYGLLWTMILSYPLMTAIQEISARIGRVTGVGIAANLRKNYPKPLLYAVLFLVSVANVFNLGADIGAMGAATHLVVPGNVGFLIVIFGVGSLAGVLLVPYSTYAKYLKWLTLSLFAYVGVAFFAHVSWAEVFRATFRPHIELSKSYPYGVGSGARHDHQSLSFLLASVAGSGGGERKSWRKTS